MDMMTPTRGDRSIDSSSGEMAEKERTNLATSPEKMDNEEPTWKLVLDRLDKISKDITKLKLGQQSTGLKLEEMVKENLQNAKKISSLEQKLQALTDDNTKIRCYNSDLQKNLLDLEYRQWQNNLVFNGVAKSRDENDTECQRKIKEALHHIPGQVVSDVKIARCHQLGVFKKELDQW